MSTLTNTLVSVEDVQAAAFGHLSTPLLADLADADGRIHLSQLTTAVKLGDYFDQLATVIALLVSPREQCLAATLCTRDFQITTTEKLTDYMPGESQIAIETVLECTRGAAGPDDLQTARELSGAAYSQAKDEQRDPTDAASLATMWATRAAWECTWTVFRAQSGFRMPDCPYPEGYAIPRPAVWPIASALAAATAVSRASFVSRYAYRQLQTMRAMLVDGISDEQRNEEAIAEARVMQGLDRPTEDTRVIPWRAMARAAQRRRHQRHNRPREQPAQRAAQWRASQ